jgi:hypothetical protein
MTGFATSIENIGYKIPQDKPISVFLRLGCKAVFLSPQKAVLPDEDKRQQRGGAITPDNR